MSGGPHHNPHGRQGQLGAGWNHLQVPEYFPRHPMAAHLSSERPLTWHTPAPLVPPTAAAAALYRHTPTPPDAMQVLKGGTGSSGAVYRHTPTPPDRDIKSFRHTPTPPDKIFRHSPPPNSGVAAICVGTATDGRRCVPSPLLNLQHVMAAAADNVREHYAENLARTMRVEDPFLFARKSPAAPGSVDLSPAGRIPPNGDAPTPHAPSAPHPPVGLSVRDAGRINSLLAAARVPSVPLAPSVIVSAPPAAMPPLRPSSISDDDSCDSTNGEVLHSPRRRKSGKTARAVSGAEPAEPNSPAAAPDEPHQMSSCDRIPDHIIESIKTEKLTDSRLENGLSFGRPVKGDDPINIFSAPCKVDAVHGSEIVSDSASIVSKARRKSSFESETIDDIAALIASTNKIQNNGLENNNSNVALSKNTDEVNPVIIDGLKNVLSSPVQENADHTIVPTIENPPVPDCQILKSKSTSLESPAIDETDIPQKITEIGSLDIPLNAVPNESMTSRSKCEQNINIPPLTSPCRTETMQTSNKEKNSPRSIVDSLERLDSTSHIDSGSILITENGESAPQPSFVEVENALEKMFAGLEDSAPDAHKLPKNITPVPRKSQIRSRQTSRRSSEVTSAASSEEATPKRVTKRKLNIKERQGKMSKPNTSDAASSKLSDKKEVSKVIENMKQKDGYDSGSNASSSRSRGPYVQIKGPRDSPISVEIVNASLAEEDMEKSFSKMKTVKARLPVDVRDKVKSKGLHSSTLSIKYDAVTSDPSWICVFCKRGSHSGVGRIRSGEKPMGDLFGPYTITKDCNEYREMLVDPHDLLFKNRPKKMKLDKSCSKKDKEPEPLRVLPHSEVYAGMTGDADQLEVWMHEDCAVWAPHVRLCGGRLVGLDAAVWVSCVRACDVCDRGGATVACVQRACRAAVHVPCARTTSWQLIDDDFRAFCQKHFSTGL